MGEENQPKPPRQVWSGSIEGRTHRVEVHGSVNRRIVWTVDGEVAADKKTTDDKARIDGGDHGRLFVLHSALGTPQRATVHPPGNDLSSLAGVGGTDLVPAPGSPAAAHERRLLEHPTRYSVLQTLGAAGAIVVPIAAIWLLSRIAQLVPWPRIDLPDVPWPDLPSIPWPDLPDIPWPDIDLPDVRLPDWVVWALDQADWVVPVVVALVVARLEIRRRRRHAEASTHAEPTTHAEPVEAPRTDRP